MATASELILRARVLSEHELPELLPDEEALAILNEVYSDVWNATDWPFAIKRERITVTNGQLQLPDDYRYVVSLRHVNGGMELDWVPVADAFDTPQRAGTPRQYRVELVMSPDEVAPAATSYTPVNVLTVSPTPVAETFELDLVYGAGYVPLTLTDAPAFPADFHHSLAYFLAARILAREADDTGRAEVFELDATQTIDSMRKQLFGPVTRPIAIGSRSAPSVRLRRRTSYG